MEQNRLGIVMVVVVVVVALVGFVRCPPPAGPQMDQEQMGEFILFSKLFAPNAEPMGPEGTEHVLGQLEKLYVDRIRNKKPANEQELRRRMQVFSLISQGEIDPSRCTSTRFYGLDTSIEFLSDFPNIETYLKAKQAEQLKQCKEKNPSFQPY